MRKRLVLPALVLPVALLALLATALMAPGAPAAKKPYVVYGSCANDKPYKASSHCHYDKGLLFRGTFVFESHHGKHPVKSCFRLYGAKPVGGGHACSKLPPTAYKAYPFKVSGVRQKFSVKVTWFVKEKKGGPFKQVGSSFMKVTP
jgi:hypothetical protein